MHQVFSENNSVTLNEFKSNLVAGMFCGRILLQGNLHLVV